MNEVAALSAALAVEHQVVYGYGVAGAHLSGADRRRARAAYDAHRLRRDRLATLIESAKATPPVAAPAYALPFAVVDAASARALLVRLEQACAGAAWDLSAAAASGAEARRLGVEWLTDAALAAAAWQRTITSTPALPGQPVRR